MTADFPDDDVDDCMEMAGPTLIGDRRNIRVQIFDGATAPSSTSGRTSAR